LIPQHVQKVTLLAAVVPPNHPALPSSQLDVSEIKSSEVVSALHNLERNGLVTADVDLLVANDGEMRRIVIQIRVVEVEGTAVYHKDLLTAELILPQRPAPKYDPQYDPMGHGGMGKKLPGPGHHLPMAEGDRETPKCDASDWKCRLSAWMSQFTPAHRRPCGGRRPGAHGRPSDDGERGPSSDVYHGDYHRNRFHRRPRYGIMRFILSVVVPIIIGAAAGVGIGILSVFIAEIVGGIIFRIRGGRREVEYVIVDGKDDELPRYEEEEEIPEYTDEKQ